ncbi:MAG: fibrobacter succinogenes major paralogous domain-containing protein [Bacteroidales bacterium]|jgi:uncharacterized protein (TIGR02145 family)|nr:fibrobacter succinogenes major paralogous domain-containing protein [Bacteroidales bacterium]MDD4214195.1 fibrobacter succinogenes major paralogous domain-containing protein [Bacteroidales bacterium]
MKTKFLKLFALLILLSLAFNTSCKDDDENNNDTNDPINLKVTDYDGNEYNTVNINGKIWMTENLKVTHYRNGDQIPNVTDWYEWVDLTYGAFCNYNNVGTLGNIYGRLYNYYAVSDYRNIAPDGWHVATISDWNELISYAGGESVAGGKLKETGTTHWESPNTGATDTYGFCALPGGWASLGDEYTGIKYYGKWWTSNLSGDDYTWIIMINYSMGSIEVLKDWSYEAGLSVRCVKD